MSKQIKQMEMQAIVRAFDGVRDMVLLSISGLSSQADNALRQQLRKKNIRLQQVKNSLTRKVFSEQFGINLDKVWEGPTTVAWGASSLAELSREVDEVRKKNDKNIKAKGAVADGQQVTLEQAIKMPTKAEAIGRVVGLALAPASRLVGQILGPAATVASQVKSLKDKAPEEAAPATSA